jgi:hypothetical protein
VDLSGTPPAGYAIRQLFAAALTSGQTVTVTVRDDADNWAVYRGAVYTAGSPNSLDLSAATLLESAGTLADNASVEVFALEPDAAQFPALYTPAISSGALVLDLHGERMVKRDFQPGGRAELQLKDVRLMSELAASVGLDSPTLRNSLQQWERLVHEKGLGDLDHSGLFRLYET